MKALNIWFDALPEPRRFLVFCAFVNIPVAFGLVFYPPVGIAVGLAFGIFRLWPWR
jgi:hypothetical protein